MLAIAVALAGCGIRTFREALLLPVTAARRLADAAVLAALVVVRLPSTVPGPAIAAESPLGVESLTLSAFRTLSSDTPADARLVDDDGLVHVLATVTHTPLIAPVPEALRNAAADQPIFALPPTQAALVHEGFALDPVPVSGFAGLARVTAVGECATTRGVWRDATGLIGAGAIAFVAPTPDTRGPIAAYFAGTSPFSPGPRGWPAPALRGWYATVYDHANADQVRALQADLSSDGLPADDPIGGAPFVTRLEMWRVPDAPRILDVGLGSTVTAALVRANNAADPGHVLLCPSRPVAIAPLRVPR